MTSLRPKRGRFTRRTRKASDAPSQHYCPIKGCPNVTAHLFCETHWPLIDGGTRKDLMTELKLLKAQGTKRPNEMVMLLMKRAVTEVATALYRAAAAPAPTSPPVFTVE